MNRRTKNIIRTTYIIGQFVTVSSQFMGSMLSLWDYDDPNNTGSHEMQEYLISALVSIIAASIFSFTANKFQGIKIVEDDHEDEHKDEGFSYVNAPPHHKKQHPRSPVSNFRHHTDPDE